MVPRRWCYGVGAGAMMLLLYCGCYGAGAGAMVLVLYCGCYGFWCYEAGPMVLVLWCGSYGAGDIYNFLNAHFQLSFSLFLWLAEKSQFPGHVTASSWCVTFWGSCPSPFMSVYSPWVYGALM